MMHNLESQKTFLPVRCIFFYSAAFAGLAAHVLLRLVPFLISADQNKM